jgi:hypothetical protein
MSIVQINNTNAEKHLQAEMHAMVIYLDKNMYMWINKPKFIWIEKSIKNKLLVGEDGIYKSFAHKYLVKFGWRCKHTLDDCCKNPITNKELQLCNNHIYKRMYTYNIMLDIKSIKVQSLVQIILDYLY